MIKLLETSENLAVSKLSPRSGSAVLKQFILSIKGDLNDLLSKRNKVAKYYGDVPLFPSLNLDQ